MQLFCHGTDENVIPAEAPALFPSTFLSIFDETVFKTQGPPRSADTSATFYTVSAKADISASMLLDLTLSKQAHIVERLHVCYEITVAMTIYLTSYAAATIRGPSRKEHKVSAICAVDRPLCGHTSPAAFVSNHKMTTG